MSLSSQNLRNQRPRKARSAVFYAYDTHRSSTANDSITHPRHTSSRQRIHAYAAPQKPRNIKLFSSPHPSTSLLNTPSTPHAASLRNPNSLPPKNLKIHPIHSYAFGKISVTYWPSRDPIAEKGGINLYGFVGNDGVNQWDILGFLSQVEEDCLCDLKDDSLDELKVKIKSRTKFYGPRNSDAAQNLFADSMSKMGSSKGTNGQKSTGFALMAKFLCQESNKPEVKFEDDVIAVVDGILTLDPDGWSETGTEDMSLDGSYAPEFPDDVVLAHELGHSLLDLRDPHNLAVENAYRAERGLKPRAFYRDKTENPLFSYDGRGLEWRGRTAGYPWGSEPEDFLSDTAQAGRSVNDLRDDWGGGCCDK